MNAMNATNTTNAMNSRLPMTKSARTVFVFGMYLAVLGIGLLAAPGPVLAPFGLPAPQEVWVRVGGMVIAFLGVYYVLAAKHGLRAFLAWTVATRASVIVGVWRAGGHRVGAGGAAAVRSCRPGWGGVDLGCTQARGCLINAKAHGR